MTHLIPGIQRWMTTLPLVSPWVMLLAKITLLLGAAWLLHSLLSRVNPRWQVLLWRMAAVGVAALPLTLGLNLPLRLQLGVLPAEPHAGVKNVSASTPWPERMNTRPEAASDLPPMPTWVAPVQPITPAMTRAAEPLTPQLIPSGLPRGRLMAALWLTVVFILVLRWVYGFRRMLRLIHMTQPAPEALVIHQAPWVNFSATTVARIERHSSSPTA